MIDLQLINKVRQCAFTIRQHFASGYLESVYRNALLVELYDAGLNAVAEQELRVVYKKKLIGCFKPDIIVEDSLILELKAVSCLLPVHELQLVNYLTITNKEIGLLINYGGDTYECRPKFRTKEIMQEYKMLTLGHL